MNTTAFNNSVPWPVLSSGLSNFNTSWAGGEGNLTGSGAGTPQPTGDGSEKAIEGMVMAAIVIGVILTTVLLFSLAIFLDCRSQKLEADSGKRKTWRPSRRKSRIPVFIANSEANKDALAFANQMCTENSATNAPARGSDAC